MDRFVRGASETLSYENLRILANPNQPLGHRSSRSDGAGPMVGMAAT